MESQTRNNLDQERLVNRIDGLKGGIARLDSGIERMHRLATMGMLAGSIAHEFNNILTPVLSYAQMAIASPQDHELTQKALRKAVDGTERAARIAAAMLGFVRDDDQVPVASVHESVERAIGCLGRDFTREGIAMSMSVSRDLKARIRPIALEQVLVNLVLNAVEAVRPASGRIEVSARRSDRSTWNTGECVSEVIIEIDDTGGGIAAERIDTIFEPFHSTKTSEDGRKGTGLGLPICKRLVEETGGTIHVRSEVGIGTRFTIRLPAAE
jgi:signal transduction histidine kinase